MIKIKFARTTLHDLELTDAEAASVVKLYLEQSIMKGMYINRDGELESWMATHGSGITATHGPPTEIQTVASRLLALLPGITSR